MSSLNVELRARLLQAARAAITADLTGSRPATDEADAWPPLERCGVFVTLRKGRHLRGCIGTFHPDYDLPELVRRMATAAAHDPRFSMAPISAGELADIRLEISVLSPLEKTADPLSLELGIHGIYITRGGRSGCFLPKVASDQGWDRETFLSRCCQQKAHLASDAWRDPETEVYLFTVEDFHDS